MILVCVSVLSAGKSFAAILVEADGLQISCTFKKIKIHSLTEDEKPRLNIKFDKVTFVYAELIVTNDSDVTKTYNLKKYFIAIDGKESREINIDSIAYFLIQEKVIKPKAVDKYSVYWVMEGVLKEEDLLKAKIVVQNANQK